METPEIVASAFSAGEPVIFVGLHFGDLELPSRMLAAHVGQAVAPMETIGDPALQAYFERTRGANGVRIVGLREARRELLGALRDGVSVGLVGDRDLTGGGVDVTLFGAPATLPLGPALLSIESGAPMYVVGVRRAGRGRYRGRLEAIPVPPEGPRRGWDARSLHEMAGTGVSAAQRWLPAALRAQVRTCGVPKGSVEPDRNVQKEIRPEDRRYATSKSEEPEKERAGETPALPFYTAIALGSPTMRRVAGRPSPPRSCRLAP